MDYGIFYVTFKEESNQAIQYIVRDELDIEYKDSIKDYLGVTLDRLEYGLIKISQTQIIQYTIKLLNIQNKEEYRHQFLLKRYSVTM